MMNKINEYGRSMVEMLGVLAIIGVLSAGGLAGYSKAMHKYRINQAVEIFRHSLQRLAELEYMPWGDGMEIYPEDAVKYGLFPKEMCDGYEDINGLTGDRCQLPIGEITFNFYFSTSEVPMNGEYWIYLTKGDKVQSCIDFLSQHWEKQTPAGWWKEKTWDGGSGGFIYVERNGYTPVYSGTGVDDWSTELTLDNIVSACNERCKGDYCLIYMVFRGEL